MSRALKIVIAGHVDHGKSTLIGRLLYDCGALPDGKVDELHLLSRKRGVDFEWSFVLDALQVERDQAITIDTTRVWLQWNNKRYTIIDAPGHRDLIRNMLSGAAEAEAAVLVVDAVDGVSEQTRRHAQLLRLLSITQIAVALNKIDRIHYNESLCARAEHDTREMLAELGLCARAFVPISARDGDNIVVRSRNTPWYGGTTLIEALEEFIPSRAAIDAPLRMRIQDVYRLGDDRITVGRVDSGSIAVGEAVLLLPLGTCATVRSIERWNAPRSNVATAGESIGLTFEEPVFVNRGDLIGHIQHRPILDNNFTATCFWLDDAPPREGEQVIVKFGSSSTRAIISGIDNAIDSITLERIHPANIPRYSLIQVRFRTPALIPLDDQYSVPNSSRLVVLRTGTVAAGGMVRALAGGSAANLQLASHLVTREERAKRTGHDGAVIWLTGLSCAGKSTLAMRSERALFTMGACVYVLDGDNIRLGLNSDLGFSDEDRSENIRRVAEVAALFADAGCIVITAFISPMRRDREAARQIVSHHFHEIFISTTLATCEARDTKGFYRKARAGQIPNFTGVSGPYESPEAPDLTVDAGRYDMERCVDMLLGYVCRVTGLRGTSVYVS